jgi:hypothetical protein
MFLVSPENDVSLLSHFPKLLGMTVSDSGIAEFLFVKVRLQFQRPWIPDPSVGRVWGFLIADRGKLFGGPPRSGGRLRGESRVSASPVNRRPHVGGT